MRKLLKQLLGRMRAMGSHPALFASGTLPDAKERDIRRKELGRRGEEAAEKELNRQGYRIIDRNYICRTGEVDIIAEHNGCVVFVEVKTRSPRSWHTPESAVTSEKQARIARAAAWYLSGFKHPSPSRFDIVSVLTDANDSIISVEIKPDAFVPGGA